MAEVPSSGLFHRGRRSFSAPFEVTSVSPRSYRAQVTISPVDVKYGLFARCFRRYNLSFAKIPATCP